MKQKFETDGKIHVYIHAFSFGTLGEITYGIVEITDKATYVLYSLS